MSAPGLPDGCSSCPVLGPYTTDTSSAEEEAEPTRRHKKPLTSGKLRTANKQVIHKVEWPHELVYRVEGKPAECETLSVPFFISGYIKIMDGQKPDIKNRISAHLAELMGDAEIYGSPCFPCHMASTVRTGQSVMGGCKAQTFLLQSPGLALACSCLPATSSNPGTDSEDDQSPDPFQCDGETWHQGMHTTEMGAQVQINTQRSSTSAYTACHQ